jgi:hypothetical protein
MIKFDITAGRDVLEASRIIDDHRIDRWLVQAAEASRMRNPPWMIGKRAEQRRGRTGLVAALHDGAYPPRRLEAASYI